MHCYYCGETLTSDDYKLDRIVTSPDETIAAHRNCITRRASEPNFIEPKDLRD